MKLINVVFTGSKKWVKYFLNFDWWSFLAKSQSRRDSKSSELKPVKKNTGSATQLWTQRFFFYKKTPTFTSSSNYVAEKNISCKRGQILLWSGPTAFIKFQASSSYRGLNQVQGALHSHSGHITTLIKVNNASN